MNAHLPVRKPPAALALQRSLRFLAELCLMVLMLVMTAAAIIVAALAASTAYVLRTVTGRRRPARPGWRQGWKKGDQH